MKNTLKMALVATAFMGTSVLAIAPASAAPFGISPQVESGQLVQDIRYGCGPGRHPNRWGRCVGNRRAYRHRGWRY